MPNTKEKAPTIGISSVNLHAFMKTLKSDISEALKWYERESGWLG